jgi:8-oxo-dGTP pyrophosphatase MutT (NUDIX family)
LCYAKDMQLQVGVKILLKNNNNEYLFLRRAVTLQDEAEPYWDIPGGRIDPTETLSEALHREILEETGLKVDDELHLVTAQDIIVPAKDLHVVRLTYTAMGEGEAIHSDEHQETLWATREKALALHLDPYLKEALLSLE